jgi:hypothetical protein
VERDGGHVDTKQLQEHVERRGDAHGTVTFQETDR